MNQDPNCTMCLQLLSRNVERSRRGLVFKAPILVVSLNSRLESNKEEEKNVPVAGFAGFRNPAVF